MFHRIPFLAVIAVATLLTIPAMGQSLNGEWTVASGTMDGQTVPANALTSMKLTINSANFSAVSGSLTSSGTLGANSLASPAQLVFTIDNGADSGNKVNAIYKFNNDELTITFSKGGSFPSGFDSTAENKCLQLVYRQGGTTGGSTAATNPGQQPNAVDANVGAGEGGGGAASVFK